MATKSEKGKPQTRKQAAQRDTPETQSQRAAMSDFGAAIDAARRHADDVQAHATDALKTAVNDIKVRRN